MSFDWNIYWIWWLPHTTIRCRLIETFTGSSGYHRPQRDVVWLKHLLDLVATTNRSRMSFDWNIYWIWWLLLTTSDVVWLKHLLAVATTDHRPMSFDWNIYWIWWLPQTTVRCHLIETFTGCGYHRPQRDVVWLKHWLDLLATTDRSQMSFDWNIYWLWLPQTTVRFRLIETLL